ncbi:MAG: hypothetical protein IJO05_03370 [Oscillospiraceae bacterium]|nr:hypothetical protein [Oscillospiraceae bacterium]
MTEISIKQIKEIGQFWVVYTRPEGAPGHIQLSACANNFRIHRGCDEADGLKCVGLRYEKDGFGCYELFNVGHTLIKCPLKPRLFGSAAKLREKYEGIEKQLNRFGWRTVEE